jgi:hypothetical protein
MNIASLSKVIEMTSDVKKVLFFEVRGDSIIRFPLWLSKSLKKIFGHRDFRFVFLADNKIKRQMKCDLFEQLGHADFYESSFISSVSSLKVKIAKISPQVIVIFAHRLPDMAVLIAAKQLGIPTVYYQHGLYVPFMPRTVGLFFSKALKTLRYAFYAISVGSNSGVGRVSGLISCIKFFIFGHNIREVGLCIEKIVADTCLVYGDHWVDYHIENYGYSKNAIRIVGTPDLDGIDLDSPKLLDSSSLANKFCYVAQTLVEDGRLERSVMADFLKNLAGEIKSSRGELLIKLHPRSDKSLYTVMKCNYKFCDVFPAADIFIGHYSTILIRGIAYSEKFLLINFKGHEIPEYIRMLASEIVESDDKLSLNKAIENLSIKPKDSLGLTEKRKKIKNYFDVSDQSSFDRAAIEIYSLLECK